MSGWRLTEPSALSHVDRLMPHRGERPKQPVVNVRLHSTSDASSRPALLLPHIQAVFSVVVPCPRGSGRGATRQGQCCFVGPRPRTDRLV